LCYNEPVITQEGGIEMGKPDTSYKTQFDMLSAGQMLKEAREKLNLTRAEIAESIYLGTQVIIDLENDHYTHLGAEVYIRGYLRNYARFVNLTSDTVLSAFETIYVPPLKHPSSLQTPVKKKHTAWLRIKNFTKNYLIKISAAAFITASIVWLISWYGEAGMTRPKTTEATRTVVNPIEFIDTDAVLQ
jgi:cytoskeletal protein RodZ